jgi:RimJ/RimL family protein N-acetyltransferase
VQPLANGIGTLDEPFLLHDGRCVTVRHIRPADADLLMDFYARLSPEAGRQRFFHAHRVTADECQRMAAIEDNGGVALVALADEGTIVADARCVPDTNNGKPGDAGFAIAIRDDHQRAGLGTLLVDDLVAAAASAGITTLVAEVLGDNVGMRRLLSKRHFIVAGRDGSSMVQAVFSTDGRVPGWGAETAHPRVLIEARGWYGSMQERYLRDAGYSVTSCPGPHEGGSCDLLATGSCQLVDRADAIICSVCDQEDQQVLAAHQASQADTPLFVTVGRDDPPPIARAEPLRRSGTAEELLDALDRDGIPRPRGDR